MGRQPLVLYKGNAVISKVVIARTLEELNNQHPEFEMSITNVADSSHPIGLRESPGKEFVILQRNQAFEANGLVPIPIKRAETKLRSLAPGRYFVQVRVDTWPESRKLGKVLRDRWRGSGYLWLDSVTSTPVSVEVAQNPTMASCE
jgi:hypothetical protein